MNKHVKILLTLKSLGFAFLFSTGLVAHAAVDNGDVNPASTTAMQQSKKISGIITDEKGEPIIGANIAVVGTTIGIISDMDGKYELEVPEGAEVKVSYIGYNPQSFKVTQKTSYNIILKEDSEMIDEVVVVGYGTIKKSDISGSVVSVDKEQMMKRNPLNLAQGLQGSAAGVMVSKNSGDPEGTATIRIRGVATVNGSADPLYVVDGVQVGSNANFVNPADVESIEVLKDASATAIYGARGANGVVMITTKKGVKGATQLNFSANFGIQNMTGKLDVADADLFAYSVRQGRANDAASIQNKAFGADYAGRLRTIDWQDVMTRTALQQNYMLSVSGGNDKTQSTFSVGYLNNDGVILDSNFSRLTARANVTHKVKDFIEVGGNVAFVHSEKVGGGNLRSYATLTPTMDYVDETTGQFISNDWRANADGTYNAFMQISGEGDIQKGQDNPYAAKMEEDKTPTYENKFVGSAYLNLNLFKGLQFRTIGSYTLSTVDGSGFNVVNPRSITAAQTNSFWMNQSQDNNIEIESYFTYNWKNDIHNLTVMAGNSVTNYWGHWVSSNASNFLADTYRQMSLTSDQTSRIGDGGYNLKTRYISWYGRAMYTLMDRYIVTATVRRDGSSNFGSGNRWGTFPSAALAWRLSEEDFIKNLDIFSNMKLRFGWGQTGNAGSATSLSVAQLSSNRIAYDWGQLGGSSSNYNKVVGFAQLKEIDTNLKWETNTQTNIGLDLGLLNNDLNITMDYFIRDSKDLLLYRNMRPSTGHGQVYTNAGHIQNKGFEFSVSYNKRFGDWNLGATLTGSTLKNKVIEVGDPIYNNLDANGDLITDDGDNWTNHSVTMEGHAVGSYYGYVVEGIFQNQAEVDAANALAKENGYDAYQVNATTVGDFKYKDLNGDGHIDGDDQKVLGNGFPKLNYGLTLNASWKNWDAMIYMYGVAGMKINSYAAMKMTQLYKTGGGVQNTLKEYINNAWSESNTNTMYPRMTMNDNNTNMKASDAYVKKGDFLKIANIQIGYTFPKRWLQPLRMDNARIFASVENLACFSGYNKFGDPEVGNAAVLQTGFDGGRYPYPRTFTFGLSVQF
ncbi:SusC/RagA family TonB-linked outer membrane protein [Parabacteroides faecis]|uniref:TonB-linked SusC/RagA family outer membrane protein n=1 Tax=Parabacteroides faecis TaxID=1217282 RepID=A0ABR6KL67_9BACT|nr:TonB-dependent receptor [Parabacteroides faecis]MBB4622103.1 TonB-linked SusC/RagA family outer membrane protein [Parabacteroides faecis]GGJ81276.1 SusC/RagA family TonB-linked outer membrane protein [Parabacteroides faecis]